MRLTVERARQIAVIAGRNEADVETTHAELDELAAWQGLDRVDVQRIAHSG